MKPISEAWSRTIDSWTKIVTAGVIFFGAIIALVQYLDHKEEQTAIQRIESTKPLLEQRLAVYMEATTVVSTIATSTDKIEVEKAKERFWVLYHGPIRAIGDFQVMASMQQFGNCFQNSACKSLPELSDRFADSVAASLSSDWRPKPPSSLSAGFN